jgi:hypothetical protein
MQQFVVPQFIDVEGKIIGPITTKQFVLMLGGGLIIFVMYRFAPFNVFLIVSAFVMFFVVVFGFVKVNGRPIIIFLTDVFKTLLGKPLVRVWYREASIGRVPRLVEEDTGDSDDKNKTPMKTLGRTRLSELTLIVDTGGVYNEDEN